MPEKEKLANERQFSRRQFIKNAGIVVGGTAVGSSILFSACGNGEDITTTVTKTVSVTTDVAKYISPFDGQEFSTLAALEAHITDKYLGEVEIIDRLKYVSPFDNMEFETLSALRTHIEENFFPAEAVDPNVITLAVNGAPYVVKVSDNWTLAYVIREKLGFTGSKRGCDSGGCGVCTIIVNNRPVLSCMTLAIEANGANIETVEGLAKNGQLNPLQQAFIANDGMQCGFCTPGQIMTATALLRFKPNTNEEEAKDYMAGTLCRCGAHPGIIKSILDVAG